MKFKLHYMIAPLLVGVITSSCEQKELDELVPNAENVEAAVTGNLIYQETFEGTTPFSTAYNKEVGTWDYALQYVSNPVYRGAKAARFEIRLDQPLVKDGKRSEVTIVKGELGVITKNTWYSFAAYFPSQGFEYDSEREVINQWYQNGSPATSLRIHKDHIILESGNTMDTRKQHDLGVLKKDTWNEFVFHFIHSYGTDGLIEVWLNGVKVKTVQGGNMYNDVLPKWKIGLYKSAFKTDQSDVTKRIIYFDNIKVGNANATFAEMTPNSGTAPAPSPTPTPLPEVKQQIVSFTLVNAITNKDIMTLANGAVLKLSTIGTNKLNIRANSNLGTAGVVKFNLTGTQSKSRLDDVVPYALFGDDRNGSYNAWSAVTGSYSLSATMYAGTKDKVGTATGPAYSINFTIQK